MRKFSGTVEWSWKFFIGLEFHPCLFCTKCKSHFIFIPMQICGLYECAYKRVEYGYTLAKKLGGEPHSESSFCSTVHVVVKYLEKYKNARPGANDQCQSAMANVRFPLVLFLYCYALQSK